MKSYPLLVTLCVYFLSATNVITFQKDWKPFSFRMIYKFLRFSYMLKLKITEDSGLKNKFSRHYLIKVYLFLILCIIMTLSHSQHFTKIHIGKTLFGFCFKCFILWIYIYSDVLYDKYFNFSMMEELQDDIYVLYYSSEFVRMSHETWQLILLKNLLLKYILLWS